MTEDFLKQAARHLGHLNNIAQAAAMTDSKTDGAVSAGEEQQALTLLRHSFETRIVRLFTYPDGAGCVKISPDLLKFATDFAALRAATPATDGAVTGAGCSPGIAFAMERTLSQYDETIDMATDDKALSETGRQAIINSCLSAKAAVRAFAASLRPATPTGCSAGTEVLEFLNSIEGAGYGGMASFEIARAHARDMRGAAQPPDIDLMQRVWANLYYNEEDAGSTFQQTLNGVVDWLAERNSLPEASARPPGAAQAEPNRHTVIERAIRDYCRRQSSAAVQEGRIYYAGLSITDLVNDIEAALTLSPDVAAEARNAVIEECAKVAEAEKQTFISPEYASNQPFGSLCERFACDEVAKAIRALSTNCSCGGDAAQPADHHDINCPLAISSTNSGGAT